jgi:hypothetical protein
VRHKTICLEGCQRSAEPVVLKWKKIEEHPGGNFYIRSGPSTVKLVPDTAREYIKTRFPNGADPDAPAPK